MQKSNQTIKYIMYCRKSSEQEDRQVLSIESQRIELTNLAKREKLNVIETLEESHSAKKLDRPVFAEMIKKIQGGYANGLLVWSPNRISRNPVDTGKTIYSMDLGKLVEVKTPSQTFYNTNPNDKFMLALFCNQAKLENDNKGEDVKRGLKTKAEKGMYPNHAPTGYRNDKYEERGKKQIYPDGERFDMVRKMVDMMLTNLYSPAKVLKTANDDWGFKMPNGKPMSKNTIYNILTNPAYTGTFEYPVRSGIWHRGTYKPLMTTDEYDRIQVILGIKGKPRPQTHIFAFTGLMKCGECGASITAEQKIKKYKNGTITKYIYYHCTKRVNPKCPQLSVEVKDLEKQIETAINSFTIPADIYDFAIKWFKKENAEMAVKTESILDLQNKEYKDVLKKLSGLIDMRAGQEITEDEFKMRKAPLTSEKERWENIFAKTGKDFNAFMKKADEVCGFARDAKEKFEKGEPYDKKAVFSRLGSHLLLKDKIVVIDMEKTLIPLKDVVIENRRLEPMKTGKNRAEIDEIYSKSASMLTDSVVNPIP